MKIRCQNTVDHSKEFLFPIEIDLNKSLNIPKSNIYETYQKNKLQTPSRFSLQSQFLSKSQNRITTSPMRLYPEKNEQISISPRKPLTPTSNPQQIRIKGLTEKFNEMHLKRNLRHEGLNIVYCRQNYNKINNKGDGTGELMIEEMKNIKSIQSKLSKFGLEIEEESKNHGVKHIISERFAQILQSDKSKSNKIQHNYFRA